ncbi:17.8 kDa class I heat shock protein-like [Cornus florida]|uniref:17.8 kDa class I heat shock protein-like n=1 Tax=Cornus florida TaxID=4283 RepID=UPI00289A3478|nr:17.8 kDa class I heat shock protein-like [Cornus florida]
MSSIFSSHFDPFFWDTFGLGFGPSSSRDSNAYMDWKETPDAHIFKFDLPGLTKDDVKLQLHDDRVIHLTSAERKENDDDKCNKWHCKERSTGTFYRQFRLPDNAQVDQIKASMQDGVLVVTVPKDQLGKKKSKLHKAVQISGDREDHTSSPKGLGRFVCCKA